MKALELENRELKRADEILRKASVFLPRRELNRRGKLMVAFIELHREVYGVEPICSLLCRSPRRRPISARLVRPSWSGFLRVSGATLGSAPKSAVCGEWGHWYNHHRIMQAIRNLPPAELEAAHCQQLDEQVKAV